MAGLIEELKRRNVIRVCTAYVVTAWVILQFTDLVLDNLDTPNWVMQVIMLLLAAGLPLAAFVAWAFELTPEGLKRERDIDRSASDPRRTSRQLDRIIIGVLLLAIVLIVAERVFLAGTSVIESAGRTNSDAAKTIAVLPLADLSENQNQEWFADGLAEEILNALARTPDLLVSSRTSAFAYKDTNKDIKTIAAELGVAFVLEGSVRQAAGRLRVTAQLIRAADGFHLWSQNYDPSETDVIGMQEDLAIRIATALQTSMDPAALEDMLRVGTRSVEAYQEYLHGIFGIAQFYASYRKGPAIESYEHFENARRIDPRFHEAHRRAASFWAAQLTPVQTMSGLTDLNAQAQFTSFRERIDLAIETARNDIDRYSAMAQKALVETRIRDAIRLQQRYLAERPNDLHGWKDLGYMAGYAWDLSANTQAIDRLRAAGMADATAAQWAIDASSKRGYPHSAADYGLEALERWPTNLGITYQTHRALLWEMRIDEADRLAATFDRQNKRYLLVRARQDCAEGRRDELLKLLERRREEGIEPGQVEWHLYTLLDDQVAASEVIRRFEVPGMPYAILSWLGYDYFDPAPFASLMKYLAREDIQRPPPLKITFGCPPATGSTPGP